LKEIVTRGYLILTVNEQSDYLYFIVRGYCKILYPIENLPHIFGEASLYDA
jgi:CRP-like cAMP-binding protein